MSGRKISNSLSKNSKEVCNLVAGQCQSTQVSDEAVKSFKRKPYDMDVTNIKKIITR